MTVDQFSQALDNFLSECQRIMRSEAREESRLTANCLNQSPELDYLLSQKDHWNSELQEANPQLQSVLLEVKNCLRDTAIALRRHQAPADTLPIRDGLLHGRGSISGCDSLKMEAEQVLERLGRGPGPRFDDVS